MYSTLQSQALMIPQLPELLVLVPMITQPVPMMNCGLYQVPNFSEGCMGVYPSYSYPLSEVVQSYPVPPNLAWGAGQIQRSQSSFHSVPQEAKPTSTNCDSSQDAVKTSDKKTEQRKRIKQVFKPRFIKEADELHKKLVCMGKLSKKILTASNKVPLSKGKIPVKQRARYIGVSKNGKNWQSLIVIDTKKVYLGTYKTQIEAAVMFDFHTILIKGEKAKVNNDYTAAQILDMIKNFKENDHEFNPHQYLKSNTSI
ncbi:unnamed protein product [Moneuplotes crassus]|uniref:AP2/ERF domain-containing protein n=1 Tax=Euplotes crassus TaxID=5936 RepID=A0AAD1Y234_EUPCR|nr:unnamed protein product [Moneuplotes crassus]